MFTDYRHRTSKKHHLFKAHLCALSENNTDFLDTIIPMLGTKEDLNDCGRKDAAEQSIYLAV
ncbi:MAG: hypothetical protein GY860_15585 [Desulfobacteraceae bacterium]|nr:hypothetical protein [Desulfobacteraceae bacterium]